MLVRKSRLVLLVVLLGVLTAFMQVNPIENDVSLEYVVLQLSGARGMLSLDYSMAELLDFYLLLLPNNILIILFGKEIYEHFCIASVYVFSRCENRLKWYYRLTFRTSLEVCVLELLNMATILAVSAMRYHVRWSRQGLYLFMAHFVLFSLWTIVGSLFVNIISLRVGSSFGFGIMMVIESCLIVLLIFLRYFKHNEHVTNLLLYVNPMANIVLCWHKMKYPIDDFHGTRFQMDIPRSVLIFSCLAVFMILFGGYQMSKKEIIVENNEIGTM